MIISPSTSNNRPTQLTDLPSAVKTDIVKRVHDAIEKEAPIRIPPLSRKEAAREAARGLAKLKLVNRDLHDATQQAMNELPDIDFPNMEMSPTRKAIHNMAGANQFRQKFARLVQRHLHIEVPFSPLSPDEQKIVLEELSCREATQHLEKIKLNLCEVKLDASQAPKNQETSAKASPASWIGGVIFKKRTDAKVPQQSLFQNLLATIHAMSRDGNQSLDIDLDLSHTTMNDQDVTALAEVLPQCKVSSLNLRGNKISDEGASAIANALPHSPLINLDLSYNYDRMTDKGVSYIAKALRDSSLKSLNLSSNELEDASARDIARALPHSSLTSLDWWSNNIGDEGARDIANALPHSSLTDLNFRSNQIGDEGARDIARALPHSRLTKLDLRLNKIGDAGARDIAEALPASPLISLDLCRNKIKDDGVIAIAQAVPDSKLTSLDVSSNQIMWGSTRVSATRIALRGPNPLAVYF